MAEDLALGQGERNRHVARTLAQVSTFGLHLKIEKIAICLCLPLLSFWCGVYMCGLQWLGLISNQCFSLTTQSDKRQLISVFLYYIVHGGWSSWSVSTLCSVTCGSGVEILSRTCTNPAPKYGGRSCQGDANKQQACTKKPCPSAYFVFTLLCMLFLGFGFE